MLCSFLLVTSAHSYNRLDAIQAIQSVQTNASGDGLKVWINDLKGDPDPGVMVGESVRFSVESDDANFYLLTLVDSKGETTVIAGEAAAPFLEFPPRDSEDILEQGPPVGDQTIFVFASDNAIDLRSVGLTKDESVITLPRNVAAIEEVTAALNRHSQSARLAVAPRYTYYVDSPGNKISTRGLKRVLKKQMVEVSKPAPTTSTVVAASTGTDQKSPVDTSGDTGGPAETTSGVATGTASSALSLDIKFQYNSSDLGEDGMAQLDALGSVLVTLLESNSLPKISLEGHTDDSGSAEYNMGLSDKRAKSARRYLMDSYGLPAGSIEAYGMGESSPMVSNIDKASRALNRRVELRVLR